MDGVSAVSAPLGDARDPDPYRRQRFDVVFVGFRGPHRAGRFTGFRHALFSVSRDLERADVAVLERGQPDISAVRLVLGVHDWRQFGAVVGNAPVRVVLFCDDRPHVAVGLARLGFAAHTRRFERRVGGNHAYHRGVVLAQQARTSHAVFMPVPALFIAYLSMLLLWWQVGPQAGQPFLGFFALIPCAAAWWYVEKGRYRSGYASESGFRSPFGNKSGDSRGMNAPRPSASNRGGASENGNGFSPLRWWKRRQENRKLEAMFRNSGFDDEPDKKR